MNTVLVVGPHGVTGARAVEPDLATVALDAIDDRLAVHNGRIVTVEELWEAVAAAALGADADPVDGVTLVVPTSWRPARVEVVEAALLAFSSTVRVRRRAEVLRALAPMVVEFGSGGAVVTNVEGVVTAVASSHGSDAVLDALGDCSAVVLDVPAGVSAALADELDRRCRRRRIEVSRVGDSDVRRLADDADRRSSRAGVFDVRRMSLAAGIVAVVALLAGAALRAPPDPTGGVEGKWVLEGRVAVQVPATWSVRRVVSGPGSARVEMAAPDAADAVHLTQAVVAIDETIQTTARTLDAAVRAETAGVFTDFDPAAVVAGRPAVTYREVRAEAVVEWIVLVDRGVRIAVGCTAPRSADCERAVASAHTLGEID